MKTVPALIPAAGRGTRLRPITRYLSKPMLPLGSEPVISYTIEEALEANCEPVVVVRSPDDQFLEEYVKTNYRDRVQLTEQPEPRGLADAALRGYRSLENAGRCAMLLPDNVVLNGTGVESLLDRTDPRSLVLGTTLVTQERARYFGNSGRFESEPLEGEDKLVRITGLQEKGSGSFRNAAEDWPTRRAVARSLLPEEFFERAEKREPDPDTGEVDDVPIYRAMIQSSTVYGVPLDGDIHDMGTPERYLKLNETLSEMTETTAESSRVDNHA